MDISGEGAADEVFIVPAQQHSDPALASLGIDAPNDAAALGAGSKQVWVRAFVWHHTKTSCRIPVEVLVDTGAGGGNYSSAAFVRSVERSGRGGQSVMSSRGQGWLRAANPTNSAVPPMRISGSCELPLVFSPEDRVRKVLVRVVEGLPYGLIIGAAFLRKNSSIISFAAGGGFKPAPESPWVPFISSTSAFSSKTAERKAVSWQASVRPNEEVGPATIGGGATWEQFCAVKPPRGEEEPAEIAEMPTQPSEGSAAWEDDGTLQWELRPARHTVVPGFVSVQVDAYAKGAQPQDRQLVVVEPKALYDMEAGAELGIARGAQWWYPGTPLQCKVVNRSKVPLTLIQGGVVARIYAVNTSDKERMRMLLDPVMPVDSAMGRKEQPAPVTQEEGGGAGADVVDLTQANIAQTSAPVKAALTRVLEKYRHVFPANPKIVPACNRAKLQLPLTDSSCKPHAAKQRRYSPEETAMIQGEVEKQKKAGTIRRSQSAWAANCVVVPKKDGTVRVCQDYRGLNGLLESNSGGLGDIASIFDNMKGATCFTSIDLASGFTQLEIAEEDKHKTAFRDAHGELWEFNRCGFGLKTLPSGFAAYVGEALGPLKGKGVENWLDDIIIHTRHVDGHVDLVEKVLERLHQFGLSVNLPKSIWCAPQQEFVGMVVSRLGVQPSQAKIEAVAKLSRAKTVEEVRSLLGMGSYLRKFVRGYSSLVAPISDLLRDKRFASKRARRLPVPWGAEQDKALRALIEFLTSPLILALPNWEVIFRLHTDASELGAGAALTQETRGAERVIGYASHRWSRTDAKRSATEREVMAVLWAIQHHRPYLWGRKFVLITDCSALTWLFKSQALSSKLHRWALRLMEYDMDLQWRPGANHQLPDALSRLPLGDAPGTDIDDSFPDDYSTRTTYRGPRGPVLEGVLLSELGADEVDKPTGKNAAVEASVIFTPGRAADADTERAAIMFATEERPVAVVLCCGGGGGLMAAKGLVAVKGATDHDWRALECVRANGLDEGVRLVRAEPGGEDCKRLLSDLSPSVVMGDASRKPAQQGPGGAATLAKSMVKAFIDSTARVLLLECHPNLLRSTEWAQVMLPALREAACTVETVEVAANSVGVPSGKRKAFAVGVRSGKPGGEGEKLGEWKRDLEGRDSGCISLGGFLGRSGTYFLKRGLEEKAIFDFHDPILSITRAHVMGEKPLEGTYRPHPLDAGEIGQASELSLAEYKRLTTGRADYRIPPTVSRGAAATILADFAVPLMVREVLSGLWAKGLLAETTSKRQLHGTGSLEGLQALFEEDLAQVTPAVTRSKAGAERGRSTEKPAQGPTPLSTQPAPSAPPPPPSVQHTGGVPPQLTSQPQLRRQAPSAEYPGPLPSMIDQVAEVLRDTPRLAQRQREDARLGPIVGRLRGDGDRQTPEGTVNYVLDDNHLLWSTPQGEAPKLAIPRALVPGVLALVHSTYGHPGVARTLLLVKGKYAWPTVAQDVREYVLSCGCRRRKRARSQRVAMMPSRLLWPWEVLEMDLQDMKQVSSAGNRYLLVVVDRASRFVFAYPLESKDSVGVARKLMELLLTFGVPLSIRSDAGGEFTAKVVAHLCQWLRVQLDHGPADHPRSQGAVERMGGWLQEVLAELCKSWPARWDEYVRAACWIQRTTPDPCLPSGGTPFRILFGRDARTNLDALTPTLDGDGFRTGLDNFVAEKQQTFLELRGILKKRQEDKNKRRVRHNAAIMRHSSGERARVGDLMLVKEADSKMAREGTHAKLAHEHWTGPWQMTAIEQPGISYQATMSGRRIRRRTVSAANIKTFHLRPERLRHAFEDEFAHLAWGADLGLADTSTVAVPLYTLTDRQAIESTGSGWEWQYRGLYQSGTESEWLPEEEVRDSFTPLQLDVFHALWEAYKGSDCRPRPPEPPPKGERDQALRTRALQDFPAGTLVRRSFVGSDGVSQMAVGRVYDFQPPYWRVRYPDGDWEELSRSQVTRGAEEHRNAAGRG